jgi:hypothetical protein
MVRDRIKSWQLVKRLQNYALGKEKMESSQVRAALGLLSKCIPDLQRTELAGESGDGLSVRIVMFSATGKTIEADRISGALEQEKSAPQARVVSFLDCEESEPLQSLEGAVSNQT